jgi:3-methyladenine DNA glycosylase/8-oxoguanine DNA glycosylase
LRRLQADAAAARLEQERGIGPYSVGVVWTQGLGRFDRGIVGDLGLLKICSAIEGRWVEAEDTARILGRYEEWAGLACVYLMAGASRGLVPLKLSSPQVRRERIKARYAA